MRLTSVDRRQIKRATQAWMGGKPHQALDILTGAGLSDLWPTFEREQLRAARRRFLAEMARQRR